MIYFIVLLLLLILTYRYDYCEKEKGRLFWYLFMFVVLVLVAGLRYRIGTDSIRYETYYAKVPFIWELRENYFAKIRWEPGFVIFTSLCRTITDDFTFFQITHALFVNTAVFLFFWKNSRHPFFGLFLYCFFSYIALNTEVLREAMAVAIFLYAWPAFKRNNFIVYYLLMSVALLFHVGSSICFLCPLFVLPGFRYFFTYGRRTIFLCIGLLVVAFAINKLFFNYIRLLTFSATLVDRATAYSKNELGTSTYNMMGILGNLMKWVIYPLVAMYFLNKNYPNMSKREISFSRHAEALSIMSIYVALLTIVINIFHRFNSYFIFFTVLIISQWAFTILKTRKKKYKLSFLYWIVLFIPMLTFLVRAEFKDVGFSGRLKEYMSYFPYKSRLYPEEDRDREALFKFHRSW